MDWNQSNLELVRHFPSKRVCCGLVFGLFVCLLLWTEKAVSAKSKFSVGKFQFCFDFPSGKFQQRLSVWDKSTQVEAFQIVVPNWNISFPVSLTFSAVAWADTGPHGSCSSGTLCPHCPLWARLPGWTTSPMNWPGGRARRKQLSCLAHGYHWQRAAPFPICLASNTVGIC